MTAKRAEKAIADGLELVGVVRDFGPDTIGRWLTNRPRAELEALCVALAAMVPDDKTPAELLAWVEPDLLEREAQRLHRPSRTALAPCGTHAAFARHKGRGEQPCHKCVLAERIYQRDRKRTSRKAVA